VAVRNRESESNKMMWKFQYNSFSFILNMILVYRICEIKKFIETYKNRNKFYGFMVLGAVMLIIPLVITIAENSICSNICPTDCVTGFTVWVSNNIK
jgi:hypothetical protein